MDNTKQLIQSRLDLLNVVPSYKPTARELHSQKGHLLGRVQRKANKLYAKKVLAQKKAMNLNLEKIRQYELNLQAEQIRRARILADWKLSQSTISTVDFSNGRGLIEPTIAPVPVFQPLDIVVPKPSVPFGRMPMRRRVRSEGIRQFRRIR